MSAGYKLSYFNIRGGGEPSRYLFAYLGIDFEDKRFEYGSDEWKDAKSGYPWGVLPVLQDGDFVLSQSTAIMAYLGNKHKLAGKDEKEAARCMEYMGCIVDMYMATYPIHSEKDEVKCKELMNKVEKETIPRFVPKFEKILKDNGSKYIVGTGITYADFVIVNGLEQMKVILKNENLYENYPNVLSYMEEFYSIPSIKNWIQKRPVTNF